MTAPPRRLELVQADGAQLAWGLVHQVAEPDDVEDPLETWEAVLVDVADDVDELEETRLPLPELQDVVDELELEARILGELVDKRDVTCTPEVFLRTLELADVLSDGEPYTGLELLEDVVGTFQSRRVRSISVENIRAALTMRGKNRDDVDVLAIESGGVISEAGVRARSARASADVGPTAEGDLETGGEPDA